MVEIPLPPQVTAAKKTVTGLIRLLTVAAAVIVVSLVVWGIYTDQKATREQLVASAVSLTQEQAESRRLALQSLTLQSMADEKERQLKESRDAVAALSSQFSGFKSSQQQFLDRIAGIDKTMPAPEAESEANALQASLDKQMQALYP